MGIEAEEVTLRLVRPAEPWPQAVFELEIRATDEKRYLVVLSGVDVADLVEDAWQAGIPTVEEIQRKRAEGLTPPHPWSKGKS